MTRSVFRRLALVAAMFTLAGATAGAQSFGRNKVQYQTFPWEIIKSEHFDNFFYPAESLAVHDAARQAERWYARLSDLFRHNFFGKSLIFYADHPDFQQTNVISEQLEEGTGGVTEGLHTRVIMPFTGIYADNSHVLGHELVHVFQYNIAEGSPGGLNRMGTLPGWLIEGMAEYLSLGRDDALTAMWMRDAVMRDKFPTIQQLTMDPRFFPYRYGQALWAYIGGKWGDRMVVDLYRSSLRLGWDLAILRNLHINSDSLSKEWAASNRTMYLPLSQQRTHPDSVGQPIIPLKKSGDYNIAPSISPDGKHIAFFSSRDLFSMDLFLADAKTGNVIKKLASPGTDAHIDALSSINSSGDWSPDSKKFAFIVYADGDNEIAILDVAKADVERRIKLPGIGGVLNVAWSPDGTTLALSGQAGGMSDLYLLDLGAETMTQLTNDRYADIQPAWSPDGRSLAFVTDRGPATDFGTMVFDDLHLAVMDLGSRQVRLLPRFPRGKAINPQFTPDGRDLLYIADQDGIPDIYRVNLASGSLFRVTRVATGISGITDLSPAISMARTTGQLVFTVFKDQGQGVFSLESGQQAGQPIDQAPRASPASILPPPEAQESVIARYLADASTGLVDGTDFRIEKFKPSFTLEQIGQANLGVASSSTYGTFLSGSISGVFGDQLGDRMIFASIVAEGSAKDIGGQFAYLNLRKRWNWGGVIARTPYLFSDAQISDTTVQGSSGAYQGYSYKQRIVHVMFDQLGGFTQYPFSQTRRMELGISLNRVAMREDGIVSTIIGNTVVDERRIESQQTQPTQTYGTANIAFVGDNSQFAFTSPISGGRWRVEASPTIGTFNMSTLYADWRRYWFSKPLTLAVRGLHSGRYGKDAESNRVYPLFLGDEHIIRGYGYYSFTPDECPASSSGQVAECPVFERLIGTRMMAANLELRIPFFGVPDYGLITFPDFATHISPFVDFGIAYTSSQHPELRFTRTAGTPTDCQAPSSLPVVGGSGNTSGSSVGCAERIPVFSTGVSARINVLGYMVFEAYVAHPFQRPAKNWVWGFQLAPGW